MKKYLLLVSFSLFFVFFAGSASALNFSVDADNSSLLLYNIDEGDWYKNWLFNGGSEISASLSTPFSNPFSVVDGYSTTIQFGTITLTGSGLGAEGSTDVRATLALETGDAPYVNEGDGWWLTVLGGSIDAGGLWWDDNPGIITLANGDWFDIQFEDIGWGVSLFENTYAVNATITGHAAPVPEPATMLLLGTGLLGLAVTSRKKIFKKK